MKTIAFIVCFALYTGHCLAQPDSRSLSFPMVDSIAKKIRYHNDLGRLSAELTSPFADSLLKTRAIYKWIIENISFDYRFINKEKEIVWPECDDKQDCKLIVANFETELARKAADKKKAIDEGYAYLFKTLCMYAGIPCEVIKGYVRSKPYQLGNNAPGNHFWNAVFLDKRWYFIDATMAAGYTKEHDETGKLVSFKKEANDVYFLTPYQQIRIDHCPEKPKWQALLGIESREKFNRQPFYYDAPHYIKWLSHLSPDTGMLSLKVGDTVQFSFTYPITIDRIQVNTNLKQNPKIVYIDKKKNPEINMYALKKQVYWPYDKEGNTYTFKVPITDRSLYYIDILFKYPENIDAVKVLRYRVIIPWN